MHSPSKTLLKLTKQLSAKLEKLAFSDPVACVYNPLDYAIETHKDYINKYAGTNQVLLLGMNPGPFGMAQTGIPFGEIGLVHDWMGIRGNIGKPNKEHPKRPIDGFDCKRSEVSGKRLWTWAKETHPNPKDFFARYFVINHCPLVFMSETGANVTPNKLKAEQREPLLQICDEILVEQIKALQPKAMIGIGAYAFKRLQLLKTTHNLKAEAFKALHPSPASPIANRGWQAQFEAQLADFKLY